MSTWADLRQVVLASTDPERVAGELRTHLGLGAGFGDPELAEHGIADDTMAVGASTYLEVVSPLTDDHPLAHWLARQGGSAGYLLSIQVSDIEACLARCAADGIRTTHTQLVQGHRIAQLHPGDMAINAEIDGQELEEHEIVMGFFLLVAAGNDSTKATYTSAMRALIEKDRHVDGMYTGYCAPLERTVDSYATAPDMAAICMLL